MLRVASLLLAFSALVCCQMQEDVPLDFYECLETVTAKGDNVPPEVAAMTSPDEIQMYCMKEYLWKPGQVNWSEFNVTQKDMNMVNRHIESLLFSGRSKRLAKKGPRMGPIYPRTGNRIRREYRRLRDGERYAFHKALNVMKRSGEYDAFVRLHRGIAIKSAHFGPNFLSWHRVYLALIEEALRRISKFVALPYWDNTMDYHMYEPMDSIIWSPPFLGNGDGHVVNGAFAGWPTSVGPLTRNIGGTSTLMSKGKVASIMSKCRTSEIVTPTASPKCNSELAHNGVHMWCGGHLEGLIVSPNDPVFFLIHAYFDYLWEQFRIRQAMYCGVNPAMDYPKTKGLQNGGRPMDGFPYLNAAGYASFWTRNWYRYERSPTCSIYSRDCGTPYLRCDVKRGMCVSVSQPGIKKGYRYQARIRAAQQAASIKIGPRFSPPPSDPRSFDVIYGKRRYRRSVSQVSPGAPTVDVKPIPQSDVIPDQAADFPSQTSEFDILSTPMPLLPTIDFSMLNSSTAESMPQYSVNPNDVGMKAFVPVRVAYIRAPASLVPESGLGSVSAQQTSPYAECRPHTPGNAKVTIQSDSVNAMGSYSNYVEVDTRLPVSSVTSFVRINTPNNGMSETAFSAFHECGLMCRPMCAVPGTNPTRYEACTGIVTISDAEDTVLYGTSINTALDSMKSGDGTIKMDAKVIPRVSFHCSNADVAPWA